MLTSHDCRFTGEIAAVGQMNTPVLKPEVGFPAADQLITDFFNVVQQPPPLSVASKSWCAAIHSGNGGYCPNVQQTAQNKVHSCLFVEDRT